jgi:hypothetical protein
MLQPWFMSLPISLYSFLSSGLSLCELDFS